MGKKIDKIIELIVGLLILFIIYKFLNDPYNINNLRDSLIGLVEKLLLIGISTIIVTLVVDFHIKYNKRKQYLNSGIENIDKFSGIQFEEFLFTYYTELGYRVELTPKTNDYGADLILYKNKESIVVQAKRYSNKVGISAIQEVSAAQKYYNSNKSIVITNNYFTNQAENLAKRCDVALIDRNGLIDIMSKINGKAKTENIINNTNNKINTSNKVICDKCGAEMVERKGRYGAFLGCSNYPKCKNTTKINKNNYF